MELGIYCLGLRVAYKELKFRIEWD